MNKELFRGLLITLVAFVMIPGIISAKSMEGNSDRNTWDNSWKTFVTNVEESALFDSLGVTVAASDKMMSIGILDQTQKETYSLWYTYANDIVTFSSENNSKDENILLTESIVNRELLIILAKYYGYNSELFEKWLDEIDISTLTVAADGIGGESYTIIIDDNNSHAKLSGLKKLQFNIECGISAFHDNEPEKPTTPEEPEKPTTPEVPTKPEEPVKPTPKPETKPSVETKVENPKTGIYVSIGAIGIACLGGFIFTVTKRETYFKKI